MTGILPHNLFVRAPGHLSSNPFSRTLRVPTLESFEEAIKSNELQEHEDCDDKRADLDDFALVHGWGDFGCSTIDCE